MALRAKAKTVVSRARRPRLAVRLGASFAILLLLAAMAHPLRAAFFDHPGDSRHGHVHAGRAAAPGEPDRHGAQHQVCHFCRLDGVALPPPQLVVVAPARGFELRRTELSEAPAAASARLTRPYVRAPPRRA